MVVAFVIEIARVNIESRSLITRNAYNPAGKISRHKG